MGWTRRWWKCTWNWNQNFAESALPERGIVILVKLLMKLFDSIKCSSPPFAETMMELHDEQLHGSLRRFSNFDRNFRAGPSFMPKMLIKCSSVSICKPSPSMLCSRKFCEWGKKCFKCELTDRQVGTCPKGLFHHEFYINFFSQPSSLFMHLLLHSQCNFLFIIPFSWPTECTHTEEMKLNYDVSCHF